MIRIHFRYYSHHSSIKYEIVYYYCKIVIRSLFYLIYENWKFIILSETLQIKILLAQVGSLKNNNLDEQSLQEVIIEIVTSALRNTNIDFNLNGYTGCPRFVRTPVSPAQHLPLHYDSMVSILLHLLRANFFISQKFLSCRYIS